MRPYFLGALALLHLSVTSGAEPTTPKHNNPQRFDIRRDFFNKMGIDVDQKMEDIKMAAQVATEALDKKMETIKSKAISEAFQLVDRVSDKLMPESWPEYDELSSEATTDQFFTEEGLANFGDSMRTCSKRDCKRRYFINEALRWVKQALTDAGVFIHENRLATAALFIGASVLVTMVITSGALVPTALHMVGFGVRGPIAGSFAAAIQRQIGTIDVGSVFAQLQSAAMNGAALGDIQKMATAAFASLAIAGAAGLVGAGSKPFGQATDFERVEWKAWESKSQIDSTPELVNRMLHLWGPPTAEGCVAYGYREYRAPIWFVPKGSDPMSACLQTQASIQGVGFKTPLGCTNEGKNRVIGTWYVQSNETRCLPHWSEFEDEGCMQYGTRRMFSRLIGTRGQDDWNSICETTPAQVREQNFDQPTYCDDKGMLGIYGIFDIPDEKCECYCGRT